MKLLPYLKKGLILFIKDIRMMIISFLVLPMALAFVYGNMQKDMFEGKNHSLKPIKVNFQYDEASSKGIALKNILSQPEVRGFIIEENKEPEYSVIINDDFKDVEIKGKDQGTEQFIMLKNFTGAVINGLNQYETMQNTVNGLNLSGAEKSSLMNDVLAAMGKSKDESSIKESIIEGYRTLSSIEYFTISMFSFTSLIMIVTLASYFYKEIKEGILRRSLSTPNNRRDYFIGFISTAFIVSVVVSTVYITINRIRGIAFQENPLYLALIVLLQGLLCAAAVGTVIAFIKNEMTANIIMNVLFVVPSMLGGVFFYTEVIGSKIMRGITNSVPNALILNSYKGLALTGGLQAIQSELVIMAVLSIVLLAVSLVKIEFKWEV